jgi:hypothetical protein
MRDPEAIGSTGLIRSRRTLQKLTEQRKKNFMNTRIHWIALVFFGVLEITIRT